MFTKRMTVKLLILIALTLGVLTTMRSKASAQMGELGDSCGSSCVILDDGFAGCASYSSKTGNTCVMIYYSGNNYCVQWPCAPENQ